MTAAQNALNVAQAQALLPPAQCSSAAEPDVTLNTLHGAISSPNAKAQTDPGTALTTLNQGSTSATPPRTSDNAFYSISMPMAISKNVAPGDLRRSARWTPGSMISMPPSFSVRPPSLSDLDSGHCHTWIHLCQRW